MNACTKTREWLDDAIDGRLGSEARAAFDAHVRQCASCAAELEFATSLRTSLLRVGFDPAPAGLRESIAAEIRQIDRGAGAPASASPPRTSFWQRPPAWLSAAAAVLVLVTIAWFGFRPRRPAPAAGRTDALPPAAARAPERDEGVAAGDRTPVPERSPVPTVTVTATPAGSTWVAVAPSQGVAEGLVRRGAASNGQAWNRMRAIAAAGSAAVDELNRIVDTGATPEHRVRQAVLLALLNDNLPALVEAAGELSALAEIAADADQALGAFIETPAVAAEGKDDAAKDPESALPVTHRRTDDSRPATRADAGYVEAADAGEPALYVVTGAGVIGRVERLLAERRIKPREITLKDQDANERKRELDRQQSGYRIVEADLSPGALNEILGDIESLDGIRLAPVGNSPALALTGGSPRPAAAKRGAPAGAPTDRAAAPKPPSMRKLRLILIGR